MKEKSQRQVRVANLVRQEVSTNIIRELADYLPTPISVTNVDISKDIRYATIFFSCVDENADIKEVLAILSDAAPRLNKILGKTINTKYTPRIRFRHDDSLDYAHGINSLLHKTLDK